MPDAPDEIAGETARLIARLAPDEGYTLSEMEAVRFMRSNRPLGTTAVLYEPGIVIVCQGRKRGFFGDRVHLYDARHYLVLSVPLPFFTETEASAEEPLLALSVRLDMAVLADLLLLLDAEGSPVGAAPEAMVSTPMDSGMAEATLRLVRALADPLERRVLAPAALREIYFRVLLGSQGCAIRTALTRGGGFGRIAGALHRIGRDYARGLAVADLAREANLSLSAFHARFKAVTRTSPLRYIQSVRLHQARLLMIRDGCSAAAAAAETGYASASQFGCEFKRFFGRSPAAEAVQMRASFALAPAGDLTRSDLAI